jgi:hypothetical protein
MVALGFPQHTACGTVHMVTAHGAQPLSATQSGQAIPVREPANFAEEGKQTSWVSYQSQGRTRHCIGILALTIPWEKTCALRTLRGETSENSPECKPQNGVNHFWLIILHRWYCITKIGSVRNVGYHSRSNSCQSTVDHLGSNQASPLWTHLATVRSELGVLYPA